MWEGIGGPAGVKAAPWGRELWPLAAEKGPQLTAGPPLSHPQGSAFLPRTGKNLEEDSEPQMTTRHLHFNAGRGLSHAMVGF